MKFLLDLLPKKKVYDEPKPSDNTRTIYVQWMKKGYNQALSDVRKVLERVEWSDSWENDFRKEFVNIYYPKQMKKAEFKKDVIPADIILFFRKVLANSNILKIKESHETNN